MSKLLGILGGLGPLSSVYLYEMIVQNTKAATDQDHIDMIILNHVSVPDRTSYILGTSIENPLPYLLADVRKLQNYGANLILLPCNTAHYFYEELANSVSIPIINMIDETVNYLKSKKAKKVGILATPGTIKVNLYQDACYKNNINWITPSEKCQDIITNLIFNYIKAGRQIILNDFLKVVDELINNGCEYIILGCTELSLIKKNYQLDNFYVDTMEIIADKSINFCGKDSYFKL